MARSNRAAQRMPSNPELELTVRLRRPQLNSMPLASPK